MKEFDNFDIDLEAKFKLGEEAQTILTCTKINTMEDVKKFLDFCLEVEKDLIPTDNIARYNAMIKELIYIYGKDDDFWNHLPVKLCNDIMDNASSEILSLKKH